MATARMDLQKNIQNMTTNLAPCKECGYYKGCEDCCFADKPEYCDESEKRKYVKL